MNLTVLNLAVPSLSADLKPRSSQLLWIVDIADVPVTAGWGVMPLPLSRAGSH
jgi:hypothetical protein